MQLAAIYEIEIEKERQPITIDDRRIPDEIARERGTPPEVIAMRKHLGMK
jgi:hypothetical protein